MHAYCSINGHKQDHDAEGWLVSPEGKRIVAKCAKHARIVIDEYREKLGENWTFEAAP